MGKTARNGVDRRKLRPASAGSKTEDDVTGCSRVGHLYLQNSESEGLTQAGEGLRDRPIMPLEGRSGGFGGRAS